MYNFVVVNLYRSHIANLFGSTLCKHIINANSEKDGRFVALIEQNDQDNNNQFSHF